MSNRITKVGQSIVDSYSVPVYVCDEERTCSVCKKAIAPGAHFIRNGLGRSSHLIPVCSTCKPAPIFQPVRPNLNKSVRLARR